MNTPTKKPEARKMRTGYGLHADRLSFSRKPAMRSVKFPLEVKDNTVFDNFCVKVQSDYINCVGDINLSDWYQQEHLAKKPTYSVFDFWLDSLRAGVVFFEKENSVKEFLQKGVLKLDSRKSFTNYFSKDKTLEYFINFDAAYDKFILSKGLRPGQKTEAEQHQTLCRTILKPEFKKNPPEDALALVKKIQTGDIFRRNSAWCPIGDGEISYKNTFLILPEVSFVPDFSPQELLERTISRSSFKGVILEDVLLRSLGLFNKQAAFSNYFGESVAQIRDCPDDVCRLIAEAYPLWDNNKKELRQRVYFLSERAKRLGTTELTNHWGDYRNFFGGKIESWVSNYLRQKKIITGKGYIDKDSEQQKGEIELHKSDVERALGKNFMPSEVKGRLQDLLVILGKAYSETTGEILNDTLETYRTELADVRSSLNVAYQTEYADFDAYEPEETDKGDKSKRANTDLPHLFKDIKQLPEFVGEAKKKRFVAFIEAPLVLRVCLEKFSAFELARKKWTVREFGSADIDFTKRILESIRRKHYGRGYGKGNAKKPWHDSGFSGTRFKDLVGAFFSRHGLADDLKQSRPLFKHERARSKEPVFRSEILNQLDVTRARLIVLDFLESCMPRWNDIKNKYDLADALWLEKVRIGVALDVADRNSFELSDFGGLPIGEKKFLAELDSFLALLKKESFTKNEFGRILQSYILSVAFGAMSLLSRETYIERYCVQPMNTEQHFPLFYRESDKSRKKDWGILLDKEKGLGKKELKSGMAGVPIHIVESKEFADEKKHSLVQVKDDSHLAMFKTSPYQTQFITKAFGEKDSWYSRNNLATDLSSYSFIVEESVVLTWDIAKGNVSLKKSDVKHLFVSVPFTIQATGKVDAIAMGRMMKRRRIMGIDVGEYGVAYTILDCDRNSGGVKGIHTCGFLEEPLIHTIREFINTLKSRQVRGTFGMPSTKLARIRENAITSLRNQIHDMALRHNAEPVYELQISGFETGSGKVAKIYNSVKAADVYAENEAEKMSQSLVWGRRPKLFGSEVGAYATSYICMKCGHSPYLCAKKIDKDGEKKFARPSLEQFLKMPESKDFDRHTLEIFVKHRGNSAIYVCPKCHFVSDADVQASYWIGLKKILKEKTKENLGIAELVTMHLNAKVKPLSLQEILTGASA